MSAAFDLTSRFAKDLPAPAPRFPGFPKYNFVGGHNDPERIPIEGLVAKPEDLRDLLAYLLTPARR